MIHVERLLGGLLKAAVSGGMRPRRRRRAGLGGMLGASGGAIGVGLAGVAMAAFEHFTQNRPPPSPPPQPDRQGSRIPPPPPRAAPLTPASSGRSPPPPPPGSPASGDSLLLLRAMVAAANADYQVDDAERANILKHLEEGGISSEEREFLSRELDNPITVSQIASAVRSPQMAEQVYTVSLLAIDLDTPAEAAYLKQLASRLVLDPTVVVRCHAEAGVPPPS